MSITNQSSEMYKILHPSFQPPASSRASEVHSAGKPTVRDSAKSQTRFKPPIATQESSNISYGLKSSVTASSSVRQQFLQHTPIYSGEMMNKESTSHSQFNSSVIDDSYVPSRPARRYNMFTESEQIITPPKRQHVNKTTSDEYVHKFTRKPVPEYTDRVKSEKQSMNRKAMQSKSDQDMRAGKPSALQKPPTPATRRKIEMEHIPDDKDSERRILKDIYYSERARAAPVVLKDPIAGIASEEMKFKPSVKKIKEKTSGENQVIFTRKARTESQSSEFTRNPTVLLSRNESSDSVKRGLKTKTDLRPKDHSAEIKYEFSGGICPPAPQGSAVDVRTLKQERAQYEKSIRAANNEHFEKAKMYNYHRARTTNSSLTLTNFLYNTKP